jgi:uncharacterized protein YbaR (Trm112 family)
MFQQKLLEMLACPQCKDPIVLDASGEFLRCKRCRLKYPIREDIPIMLIEEAVPDPKPE